jgi:hypothetical protein
MFLFLFTDGTNAHSNLDRRSTHEDKEPIGTSPSNSRDECLEIRATVAVHPLGGVEVDPRFIILVVL